MASRSAASMPASRRHQPAACSGSSHVENGNGDLPCLRRQNRSSSAAATTRPSTTSAAAGSWKTALIPSTRMSASVAPAAGSQTSRAVDRPRRTDPPGFGAAPHGQDARMFDDQQVMAGGGRVVQAIERDRADNDRIRSAASGSDARPDLARPRRVDDRVVQGAHTYLVPAVPTGGRMARLRRPMTGPTASWRSGRRRRRRPTW